MSDFLEQIDQLRATEKRVAMATLVGARGGSPRPLGAKLFVGEGGRLVGSVSIGGCVDARVVEHGDRLLQANRAEHVTVVVDDTEAIELGLACGAEFDLLIEPIRLAGPDGAVDAYAAAVRSGSGSSARRLYEIYAGGAKGIRADADAARKWHNVALALDQWMPPPEAPHAYSQGLRYYKEPYRIGPDGTGPDRLFEKRRN